MANKKRILTSLAIFAAVILVGAAGFKILGGREWSLLDALYMTVITIATIGYGEVHDLGANPAARIFGLVFIILSLGTIAYAVSSITAFVIEGELKNLLGRRKMDKAIAKLKGHYIICGGDETAQTIVRELRLTKRSFVVVDPSAERIERMAEAGPLPSIQGDPAEDGVLVKAGIERAKGIFLCLATDEANLFAAITARSLNPGLRISAKGIDVRSEAKMKKAGADYVVAPAFIGGMRMVSEMVRPAVVTFLDMMLRDREKGLRVEEMAVPTGSRLIGKTVSQAKIGERTGALLVALRREESRDYDFNPGPDVRLKKGDILILMAGPGMLQRLEKFLFEG
jgi:voltage-gated potassium channel